MRFQDSQQIRILLRLTLYSGELYKAPRACAAVRVRAGVAWVTDAGADIILPAGKETALTRKDFALLSPLGDHPLVVELLGYERSMAYRVSGAALCHALDDLPNAT